MSHFLDDELDDFKETKGEKEKRNWKTIIQWVGGGLFILSGIGNFTDSPLASLMMLVAGVFMLPTTQKFINKKYNIPSPFKYLALIGWIILTTFIGAKLQNDNIQQVKNKSVESYSVQQDESSHSTIQPAKYICNKVGGLLAGIIKDRSFVGKTYKCNVVPKPSMLIMSEVNSLVTNNKYFDSRNSTIWKKNYFDIAWYSRRSLSFDAGEFYVISIYVPYQKENVDHFYIAE